jgi:hypothetical protein
LVPAAGLLEVLPRGAIDNKFVLETGGLQECAELSIPGEHHKTAKLHDDAVEIDSVHAPAKAIVTLKYSDVLASPGFNKLPGSGETC